MTQQNIDISHTILVGDFNESLDEDINEDYNLEWWKHGSAASPAVNERPVKPETINLKDTDEEPGTG